jgi:hypothetical protein
MTNERDQNLEALFDAAPQATESGEFVARVMNDVDKQRRGTVTAWVVAAMLALPLLYWISGPVISAVNLANRLMPEQLVNVEASWLAQLFSPLNSVAAATGLVFLGAWWLYRKIFS